MLHYSCNSSRDRLNGSIWIRSELLWCYFSWCTNSHSANAVSVKLVSSKKSQYNVHLQSVPLPPLWSFNFILNRQDVSHTTIYDRCVAVGFRPTVNISYSCYVMITWHQFFFKKKLMMRQKFYPSEFPHCMRGILNRRWSRQEKMCSSEFLQLKMTNDEASTSHFHV